MAAQKFPSRHGWSRASTSIVMTTFTATPYGALIPGRLPIRQNAPMGDSQRRGPLAGVKVVKATVYMAGPYAGMMLADLGADVIKMETAKGDPFRRYGRPETPYSAVFANCNRSKRSVVLDLKDPAGRDALLEILADADVFLANWPPASPSRSG